MYKECKQYKLNKTFKILTPRDEESIFLLFQVVVH